MGKIKIPKPVKLIAGVIYSLQSAEEIKRAEEELTKLYGEIDLHSETVKFDTTDYYSDEMGKDLMRYWISFENPVSLEKICETKLTTNKIEQKYAISGKRGINIDPGYITGSRLVLFSTKDYSHRIYLGKGIYAEVTLIYKKGRFHELEWTYPDYRTDTARDFFAGVRKKYIDQL